MWRLMFRRQACDDIAYVMTTIVTRTEDKDGVVSVSHGGNGGDVTTNVTCRWVSTTLTEARQSLYNVYQLSVRLT
ncbi:hypothetical protein BaRGS_00029833 [Batillaria attramentaria]|uniref:Uncharacterized protein n=1 Tax=Batillaria attramentaria TaxID=370345 RepID=A0ABD0JW68_9CAEN